MRACVHLALGFTLVACDPKNSGGTATASATATTGDATASDSTSEVTAVGVTTTDSTTAASTGDGVPDLCACDGGDCGLSPTLCDTLVGYCDLSCGSDSSPAVDNESALQCALVALRDRTPGDIAWSATTCSDGPCGEGVLLRILADGTALRYPSLETIFCTSNGPDTHNTLKEPDYFKGCLAKPDPGERFLCVIDATATELAECTPLQNCKP